MRSSTTRALLAAVALAGLLLARGGAPSDASAAAQAQRPVPAILAVLQSLDGYLEWQPAAAAAQPPIGDTGWQEVGNTQSLGAGDQARTGDGASARLIHFDGTMTDLMGQTEVRVQSPTTNAQGALVGRLTQIDGIAVHKVAPPDRAADLAGFSVETLAVVAQARGASFRMEIAPDASTRVVCLSLDPNGTLSVQPTAAGSAPATLAAGQEMTFTAPR